MAEEAEHGAEYHIEGLYGQLAPGLERDTFLPKRVENEVTGIFVRNQGLNLHGGIVLGLEKGNVCPCR